MIFLEEEIFDKLNFPVKIMEIILCDWMIYNIRSSVLYASRFLIYCHKFAVRRGMISLLQTRESSATILTILSF